MQKKQLKLGGIPGGRQRPAPGRPGGPLSPELAVGIPVPDTVKGSGTTALGGAVEEGRGGLEERAGGEGGPRGAEEYPEFPGLGRAPQPSRSLSTAALEGPPGGQGGPDTQPQPQPGGSPWEAPGVRRWALSGSKLYPSVSLLLLQAPEERHQGTMHRSSSKGGVGASPGARRRTSPVPHSHAFASRSQ